MAACEGLGARLRELEAGGGGGTDGAASQTISFGRAGAIPPKTYLLYNQVPSCISGRVVLVEGSVIRKISVAQETSSLFVLELQKRTPTGFETIHSEIVNGRKVVFDVDIAVTYGDEIAVMIFSGNAKNLGVDLLVKGTPL